MRAHWNVLVYAIDGDDVEHEGIAAEIAQMRAALTSDGCRVAVQVLAEKKTERHWISPGKIRTERLDQRVDASDPEALTDFVAAADRESPASFTALILRAHGSGLDNVHDVPLGRSGLGGNSPGEIGVPGAHGLRGTGRMPLPGAAPRGWVPGGWPERLPVEPMRRPDRYGCRWGPDPASGHFLTNVTMRGALAARGGRGTGRVDLLVLNACWMATLEVAYELRGVADIAVASQVNAQPLPYGAIVAALSRQPAQSGEQLARTIVRCVGDGIADPVRPRKDAISAFWSGDKLAALADAFDAYAERVTALIDSDWDSVRDAVMTRAQRIDDPLQVDLISLTRVLGDRDPQARAAAAEVGKQFDAMLIANVAHRSHPGVNGLSIFCPKSTRIDLKGAYRGTRFLADHKSWAAFLQKFQKRLARS